MRRLLSIVVVGLLFVLPQDASAQHLGGGTLKILGDAGDPCNTVKSGPPLAALIDQSTGLRHIVQICAAEDTTIPGRGAVQMMLRGGGLTVCTINGGGGLDLGQPVPTPNCGNAGGMAVRIDRCVATISAHGWVHADDPHTTYIGGATVDIGFNRTFAGGADGELTVTIHTPKRVIQLKGKLMGLLGGPSLGSAFVDMPTCGS